MGLTELFTCISGTWSPTLGDPTIMGWVTVVCYVAAFVLTCLNVAKKTGRQRSFWLLLSIFLLALAINKQLDLQSALTAAGRCLAQAQGWYEDRQSVQIIFILSIIGISIIGALMMLWIMRKHLGQIWLALLGFALLLAFVGIRAAGFHHFDSFIGFEVGVIRMNWLIEIGGILLIALNAIYALLRPSKLRRR